MQLFSDILHLGAPLFLSRIVDVPVVNAGDGAHEHPSQALLDLYTLQERMGSLEGKKSQFWVIYFLVEWQDQISGLFQKWVQRLLLRVHPL